MQDLDKRFSHIDRKFMIESSSNFGKDKKNKSFPHPVVAKALHKTNLKESPSRDQAMETILSSPKSEPDSEYQNVPQLEIKKIQAAIAEIGQSFNEDTVLMLSNEDRDCLLESLKNPPKPNQNLKDAFHSYYEKKFKDE